MKFLDFIGGRINIVHENSSDLKTSFGAFLSIIATLFLALAISSFGKDFFNRTNPNTSISTGSPKDYPLYNLSNKNFSFAFRLEDWDANQYIQDDTLYIDVFYSYMLLNKTSKLWNQIIWERVPQKKCNKDMFSDEVFTKSADLNNLFCFDLENKTLGGNWNGEYVYSFYINILVCEEGSTNTITGQACKPDSEKETYMPLNHVMLSLFYQYTVIETTDYYRALYSAIKTTFFKIDKYLQKTQYLFFKETQLISDYGWIISDKKVEKVLGFTSTYTDFNAKSSLLGEKLDGMLAQVILYGTRETDYIKRDYAKIQTLVAEVGGIIKFILVVFTFIGNKYSLMYTISKFNNILNFNYESEFKLNKPIGKNSKSLSILSHPKFTFNLSLQQDASRLIENNVNQVDALSLNKNNEKRSSSAVNSEHKIIHPQRNSDIVENNNFDLIKNNDFNKFPLNTFNGNENIKDDDLKNFCLIVNKNVSIY